MNRGINPGFRTVVNGTEKDLLRQVTSFEGNVADALDQISQQAQPRLVPTNLKTTTYTAQEEDLIPAQGTFTITLPVANSQNAGRFIGIVVRSGTITVNALSGQVQGGATDTLSSVGFFLYISDGVGWWRR